MELSEEEKKAIEWLEKANYFSARLYAPTILNLIEKLQKEIEERDKKDNIQVVYGGRRFGTEGMVVKDYISKDKIKEKLKELEKQKEKLKYDGNRSFADYEQFCKNLKFFKEQIEELLEEK